MYICIYSCRSLVSTCTKRMAHSFVWQGKMWICTHCLLRTLSPSTISAIRKVCRGHASWAEVLQLNSANGHRLWTADNAAGGLVIYCSKCWSYASAFPRNLLRPCNIPSHGRPCSQRYLVNRRHPTSQTRLLRPNRVHAAFPS